MSAHRFVYASYKIRSSAILKMEIHVKFINPIFIFFTFSIEILSHIYFPT